jgi:heme/copper-type cytochrome/quinol oxidase subunit 1
VFLAGLLALLADRHLGSSILVATGGPGPGFWERAVWPRGSPLLVATVLPGLGAAIACLAAREHAALAGRALAGTAAAAVVLWLVHAAAPEAGSVLTGLRLVVALAMAVVVGSALPGRPELPADPAARAFAHGALFFLALTVLAGAFELVSQARGTGQATVAHLHFAFVGAGLCGLTAGLYRAWPRLFRRRLDPEWGRAHAWVFVGCTLATFGSLDALGALGMPRRVSAFAPGGAAEAWATLASVASFALAGAFGFFGLVVAASRRSREAA